MPTAVIVDAIRTPLGRRNGKLKDTHPVDLAAHVLREIANRNQLDTALVEVVMSAPATPGAGANRDGSRRAHRAPARPRR